MNQNEVRGGWREQIEDIDSEEDRETRLTTPGRKNTIVASRTDRSLRLDAGNPDKPWQSVEPVSFSTDWQGHNPDPALETRVQALWSDPTDETHGTRTDGVGEPQKGAAAALYLRFECRYRELFVFGDSETNGRRDHLWDRDVAEAFLQPGQAGAEAQSGNSYAEFEVAPNGMWIDLDIFPSGRRDLKSGLSRSVYLDRERKIWTAELAVPLRALTSNFDPSIPWRANFYRVEGRREPRRYMAWQPTGTPQPNFHVPTAFGILRFEL